MIDFFHTFLSFYKNRPEGPVFLLYTVIFFKSFKLKHLSIFLFCVIFSNIFKNRIGPRDQCGFFRTKYLSAISADSLYDLYDFLELTSLSSFFYGNGNSNGSSYHWVVTHSD